MSRSSKIRARHLRWVPITLIAFLSYGEIAACQERVGAVSNVPTVPGSVHPGEVSKAPSRSPLADLVIGEGDLLQSVCMVCRISIFTFESMPAAKFHCP